MAKTTAKTKSSAAPPSAAAEKSTKKGTVTRTADLSEEVLKSVEAGQRAALEAVRKFVDTVDEALPAIGDPSRREALIDAALDMADKLVTTQYNFLHSVVRTADRSLTRTGITK
jgi:hypothetical protein